MINYPIIDLKMTGENIRRIRIEKQLTIRQIRDFMGFEYDTAIYKWQRGDSLPSLDNMLALGRLFETPVEQIIVFTAEADDTSASASFLEYMNRQFTVLRVQYEDSFFHHIILL